MPNSSLIPTRLPTSGKPAAQLVVLLHGWGADGANLIDLAESFAPALPDAQFIAPTRRKCARPTRSATSGSR